MRLRLTLGAVCAAFILVSCGGGERVGDTAAPEADEETDELSQPDDPLGEEGDEEPAPE